jgi:hypothetical protein
MTLARTCLKLAEFSRQTKLSLGNQLHRVIVMHTANFMSQAAPQEHPTSNRQAGKT